MSDKLKRIVERSRGDFEVYDFNIDAGWNEVKGEVILRGRQKWNWQKLTGIAACLVFLVLSTFYFSSPNQPVMDELSELEQYYDSEINQKVSLVKSHLGDDKVLDDLTVMDQAFAELKADLKDNVDNEEVVQAMMENYQLKLRILEEILYELEKERREKLN